MLRTYRAVLHGDRVEWIDPPPQTSGPTPVHITVLDDAEARDVASGRALAAIFEEIARAGGLTSVADPSAWQRETRADRPMPGRD
jgi:hypothetical protein